MKKLLSYIFLLCNISSGLCFSQSIHDSLSKIAESGKEDTIVALANLELFNEFYENGDYNKAGSYADKGYAISVKNQFQYGILKGMMGKMKVLISKGNYNESMKICVDALAIAEKNADKNMIIDFNTYIGNIFNYQKNYNKALEYYQKALVTAKEINNKECVDICLSNIGVIYEVTGKPQTALEYYNQALEYEFALNDSASIAGSYVNVGSVYFKLNDLNKAKFYFEKALKLYEKLNSKNEMAISYSNLSAIMDAEKKYDESLKLNHKALDITIKNGNKSLTSSIFSSLSSTYALMNDYKNAYENQKISSMYHDSVYNDEIVQQTSELQTKYETEKKEKENQILTQKNALQDLSINRQKIINYSISLGLLLVLGLAFFIFRGYKQKQKANLQLEEKNILIEEKNKIVEEKNKDITDSIRYAKRLQTAILKPEKTLTNYFEDGFVLFKPKDIVSGDFYWFEKFGNLSLIAAADCTGHGVPGAFMSIIGCNLLSQAVNEYAITQPAAILNSINKGLTKVLQQKGDIDSFVKDGMDIALCSFDSDKMILEYSGAFNPMWLIRDNKIIEFTADKFPVGAFVDSQVRMFKCHEIPVQKGDMVYLFSDGYADQFGGPAGKKFKYKPLQTLLLENYKKTGAEQKDELNEAFDSWMGSLEQIDDVLVIGIRI